MAVHISEVHTSIKKSRFSKIKEIKCIRRYKIFSSYVKDWNACVCLTGGLQYKGLIHVLFGISSRTQLRVRVLVRWGLGLDVICESILSKLCVYTLKHMIHILCSCKGIEKCHRMYFIDSFVKCAEKTGDKICKNNSFHFLNVGIEKTANVKPCLGFYFQFQLSIYVEYQARWHFFLFFNLHFFHTSIKTSRFSKIKEKNAHGDIRYFPHTLMIKMHAFV